MSEEAAKYTAPNIKAKAAQIAPPAEPHNQPGDLIIGEPGAPADVRLGMRLIGDDELATVTITQHNKTITLNFTDSAHAARIADALLGYQPYAVVVSAVAAGVQGEPVHVECRQCDACGHVGIDDHRDDHAACHECDWDGPEPDQDQCPGCGKTNCMTAACPACGSRYVLRDTKVVTTPQPAEQKPDVTQLVEALEQCVTSMIDSGYRADAVVIQAARAALAAYRKGGEV